MFARLRGVSRDVLWYTTNIYDKVQRTTSRLDDFTTYDLTTFTTSPLVIDLETGFIVQK
jgi:hypothetical protein